MVTNSSMKEDRLSEFRTKRMLSYKRATTARGLNGMSDMLRTNRLTKQVSTIQVMASTAIDNSTLSQREMEDISKEVIKLVEKQ